MPRAPLAAALGRSPLAGREHRTGIVRAHSVPYPANREAPRALYSPRHDSEPEVEGIVLIHRRAAVPTG